jgi:membrane-associated phospholipid phosphatase
VGQEREHSTNSRLFGIRRKAAGSLPAANSERAMTASVPRGGIAGALLSWVVPRSRDRFGAALLRCDRSMFRRLAASDAGPVDSLMLPLTKSSNYSVIWFGVATAMALTGRPELVRTAIRALLAVGITTVIANQGAKRLGKRPRPPLEVVPARIRARPKSSPSFPSGHAASAAAFATVVGIRAPTLRPVAVLAGAVAYSRVRTGLHYPGDVLGGGVIGAVIGRIVAGRRATGDLAGR